MTKNLLFAALIAELAGCWSSVEHTPTPPPPEPTRSTSSGAASFGPTCAQSGDRLVLEVCRHDRDLAWTITNRTDTTLWAFVAPQSVNNQRSRENAVARSTNGHVLLTKIDFGVVGDHPTHPGAVALAPGESDQGIVPIGDRLDPRGKNFVGVAVQGGTLVSHVALEIGYAVQHRADRTHVAAPFVLVIGFDRSRQEIVRSPEVAWR